VLRGPKILNTEVSERLPPSPFGEAVRALGVETQASDE